MLQLPPTEKDDRLNLNVRTGSASVLYNSFVFTYGGLTIGLELEDQVSVDDITSVFLLRVGPHKSKRVRKYLSGELFYLDLILKVWKRVEVPAEAPKPKARLFHELARGDGRIYVFGGLVVPDDVDEAVEPCRLVPCNDLWEFNLTTSSWRQLHDGSGWDSNLAIPRPRFCHKMTLVGSLHFAKKKDHYGLMIAGGLGSSSEPLYDNAVFDLVDGKYTSEQTPLYFLATTGDSATDKEKGLSHFKAVNKDRQINVNYLNSIIVNFKEEVEYHHHMHGLPAGPQSITSQNKSIVEEESIIIYSPTSEPKVDTTINPLLSFRIGKKFGRGKVLSLHKKKKNVTTNSAPSKVLRHTIPLNLRYPTGGLFGQNLVITGFLPNEFDISIFIYNKPTGKWSRLNIFCNHDYGSHRFWGGFAWTSHHRVVLLGNYVTSRTTSSVRYFSSMITVSLPVTNILASSEIAGSHFHGTNGKKYIVTESSSTDEIVSTSSSFTEDETSSSLLQNSGGTAIPQTVRKFSGFSVQSDGKTAQHAVTFSDYVEYAAPKVKFTKVRSVFPPAAITLGRNAFDRYGDLISDFELISCNGDRLPVSLTILMERWGLYFIKTLARAYVQAIDNFETEQSQEKHSRLRSSKSSGDSVSSKLTKSQSTGADTSDNALGEAENKLHYQVAKPKPSHKEPPQFRLPFQDGGSNASVNETSSQTASIDPHKQDGERKGSITSYSSGTSILASYLQDIPPQLPLPSEPLPAVPANPVSYRSSSRKNSTDALSPRASIIHTLNALRSIPTNASPFASPRGSVSLISEPMKQLNYTGKLESPNASENQSDSSPSAGSAEPERVPLKRLEASFSSFDSATKSLSANISENYSSISLHSPGRETELSEGHTLLDFTTIDPATFKMEPSLIPRKLYIPFGTATLKAFCEYLYIGQVGNKWPLKPCALDCLIIARYYKLPLLYDLLCEVLYGIIGRKESLIVKEGNKLKKKFAEIFEKMDTPLQNTFRSPLGEYEGFMDTVDDGYLDIALLRKSSSLHKASVSTLGSGKKKLSSAISMSIHEEGPNEEELDYFQPKKNLVSEDPKSPRSPKAKITTKNDTSDEDDTIDNSGDEDIDFELSLHYLDFQDRKTSVGPRSRSVFDRSLHDSVTPSNLDDEYGDEQERLADMTLEQLVSPDSPEPSAYIFDLIHETASLCTDVKLMLRSMNVRHMVRALKETQEEYEKLRISYEEFLDSQNTDKENAGHGDIGQLGSVSTVVSGSQLVSRPGPAELRSYGDVLVGSGGPGKLEPTHSSSSITTSPSIKSENMSRTTSSLKFTPFKNPKNDILDANRELDKRIAQMIKIDGKLKQKQAKEEKIRRNQLEKEKRKQSSDKIFRSEDTSDMMSITSKTTIHDDQLILSMATSSKNRMFKRLGTKLKGKEDTVPESNMMVHTKLTTSLTSSSSSKKTVKKGLFGLRKSK